MTEAGHSDGVYREAPPAADLSGLVQCVWYRRVGETESGRQVRVVPDGCMDLLWMRDDLLVAGPDTQAWLRCLPSGTEIVGLRFWPGMAAPVLKLRADELLNDRTPASECSGRWAGEIVQRLAEARLGRHEIMQDAVRSLLRDAGQRGPDPVVRHVVERVRRSVPEADVRVADLAGQLGISERQLHRRCQSALGYGVKTYARIARFQHFIAVTRSSSLDSLAALALEAGYADQSHLSRDVRRLTGLSPSELLAGSAV